MQSLLTLFSSFAFHRMTLSLFCTRVVQGSVREVDSPTLFNIHGLPAFLFCFPRPESLWSFLCVALTTVHTSWAAVSPRPVEVETCWYGGLSSIFLGSCYVPTGVQMLLLTLLQPQVVAFSLCPIFLVVFCERKRD